MILYLHWSPFKRYLHLASSYAGCSVTANKITCVKPSLLVRRDMGGCNQHMVFRLKALFDLPAKPTIDQRAFVTAVFEILLEQDL